MTHTIFSEGDFVPYEDAYTAFEIMPTIGPKRLFVMAIHSGAPTPARSPHMQRALHCGSGNLLSPTWANALPPERTSENPESERYWLRPIEGRVVSDVDGRLCEEVGRELRPLGRVARGPQGQLLEFMPVAVNPNANLRREHVVDGELIPERKAPALAPTGYAKRTAPWDVSSQQVHRGDRLGCRKLFADPGLPRVVELGRFRDALTPQLAHPERLRSLHRLVCYVQVYEALKRQRPDEFLEAIQREGLKNILIQPLTEESISILGVKEFLALRPRQNPLRDSGYVLPFECFYSLQVSDDPTDEGTQAKEADDSKGKATRAECTPPAPQSPRTLQSKTPSLSSNIPERFQNPWEFQFNRDEVLYDMNVGAVARGSVDTLLRKVSRWFRAREEFGKWRALLSAKGLEEQLWAVRPPRGSFSDPTIREWARHTLDDAGYDSRIMLREWEIFWRRKGV